jgi:hypothetical protein
MGGTWEDDANFVNSDYVFTTILLLILCSYEQEELEIEIGELITKRSYLTDSWKVIMS